VLKSDYIFYEDSLVYRDVLFRILIKRSFAPGATEIIRLPLVDTGEFRCFLIDRHFTNRINRHDFSPPVPAAHILLTSTKGTQQ
jgi:hypothetical protein